MASGAGRADERRRWISLAGPAAILAALLTGCGSDDEPAPPATANAAQCAAPAAGAAALPAAVEGNPLAGRPLYVDPSGPAAEQVTRWQGQQRTADADRLRRIAEQPVAQWIADGPDSVAGRVDAVVGCAARHGRLPLLVAYNIPNRDCGNFSAGGAASPEEYRAWIRRFADGVKGRPVVVILEPDAVPHAVEGCDSAERYALLADAVTVLKATGSAAVYVDAGNPRWITDVKQLAGALQRAGVAKADGFALNVANFITTPDNVAFGNQVSDALGGGTHFVVDTGRNGAGPMAGDGDVNGGPRWCNPPGRLLGRPPTTSTGQPRVDALLWVKRPGESDGACRPGEPPAGEWWPDYALDLATRS